MLEPVPVFEASVAGSTGYLHKMSTTATRDRSKSIFGLDFSRQSFIRPADGLMAVGCGFLGSIYSPSGNTGVAPWRSISRTKISGFLAVVDTGRFR